MIVIDTPQATRSQRLKAATRDSHGALDKRIMAGDIFASRDLFAKFVRVQFRFHRDIDALYGNPALDALLPDLDERRRLPLIARDLADLEQTLPLPASAGLDGDLPLPAALGWLYVAEGSNLGAPCCTRWPPGSAWTVTSARATWPHIPMARPAIGARSPPRSTASRSPGRRSNR